ncbi:C40 family peptidase [Pseudonocardia broussonetiae]|uniref:C40 family peptidase n=1 Tax=Pseudonocardia broussonetiae TaxID=2736640 RepID=A0A6M6JCT7_9PSEU|nr:C40 family peptidase [Pseudonocardia broussonetiae]
MLPGPRSPSDGAHPEEPSVPIHPASTPSATHHLRTYVTRAAVVATASAAAAVLAVIPATADAPAAAPAAAAAPVATAPAAPVVDTRVTQVAVTAPLAAAPAAASSARASAVSLALSKVGSPYRWGAAGPSAFDCSGLVNWAFERAGIDVPRTSRALSQTGTPVSRGDLRPGDLVFFYSPVSHVGIYIGDGQMVHASTSGKPVAISSIDRSSYNSARRI